LEDEITTQVEAAVQGAAPARSERLVITSGADVTLPADESVDLFIIYNGTARIEGHASSIVVVNGTANLAGARADRVYAFQGQVNVDPDSNVAGDIRTVESGVTGATGATGTRGARGLRLR